MDSYLALLTNIYIEHWPIVKPIEVDLAAPCILLFSHFCDITRIKLFHEEESFHKYSNKH